MLLFLIQNKDARYCTVIIILGVICGLAGMKIKEQAAIISAKPNVETRIEKQVVTKTVEGPTRTVEKIVAGQVVERIIYRDPIVTTSEAKTDSEKIVTQACPDVNGNRYIAGLSIDPLAPSAFPTIRGGYSWNNRLDLAVSGNPVRRSIGIDAALRFK